MTPVMEGLTVPHILIACANYEALREHLRLPQNSDEILNENMKTIAV